MHKWYSTRPLTSKKTNASGSIIGCNSIVFRNQSDKDKSRACGKPLLGNDLVQYTCENDSKLK